MLHRRRLLRRIDPVLLIIVFLLVGIGLLMIYTSTRADLIAAGKSPVQKLLLQAIWLVVGIVAMLAVMMVDYDKLASLAVPMVVGVVALLVPVLILGHVFGLGKVHGAARWLPVGPVNIQPSELAKIVTIIALGAFLVARTEQIDTLSLVVRSLGYPALLAGLIFLEPDLGTPVVLLFIWMVMLFVAGARFRHLLAHVMVAVLLFAAAWNLDIIKDHQKERLTYFLGADTDPRGQGWQPRQAKIAIGSGGLWGKGLLRGKQTPLGFIPDLETDFIFVAIGEQTGFAGCFVTIALYGLLLWRIFYIADSAKDQLGKLIAAGVGALFFVHIIVSIGMTIGLMPVKGMPLPFISYGGSNLVTNMVCVGLLQNIHMRRQKIVF